MARLVTWLTAPSSIVRRNRSALRAVAPIAISAIALLAACDTTPTPAADGGGTSDSGSGSGGGSGGGSGSGSSGGVKDASADHVMADAPNCTPAPATGTLPFVVDSVFVPSGWMGDGPAYPATPADPDAGTPAMPATTAAMTLEPGSYSTNATDACTGVKDGNGMDVGRSHAGAKGSCYRITFSPFPKGTGYGWVGAYWQYKKNNWGDQGPGYAIPAGATKISFWTRGKLGQEWVKFFAGEGDATPCMDFVAAASTNPSPVTMTTTWTQYTIDLTGLPYDTGVIGAFGFATGDQTTPQVAAAAAEAGVPEGGLPEGGVGFPCTDTNQVIGCTNSHLEFYIDDIEWM